MNPRGADEPDATWRRADLEVALAVAVRPLACLGRRGSHQQQSDGQSRDQSLRFHGAPLDSLQQSHDDTDLPAPCRVDPGAPPVAPPDARAGDHLPRHRRVHRSLGAAGAARHGRYRGAGGHHPARDRRLDRHRRRARRRRPCLWRRCDHRRIRRLGRGDACGRTRWSRWSPRPRAPTASPARSSSACASACPAARSRRWCAPPSRGTSSSIWATGSTGRWRPPTGRPRVR